MVYKSFLTLLQAVSCCFIHVHLVYLVVRFRGVLATTAAGLAKIFDGLLINASMPSSSWLHIGKGISLTTLTQFPGLVESNLANYKINFSLLQFYLLAVKKKINFACFFVKRHHKLIT